MTEPEFTTEELAAEEWRDIPGHPTYQASSLGRIRRVVVTILNQRPGWGFSDYNCVGMVKPKTCTRSVHVLIAETFHGPRPQGHYVNHIDGDKKNNRPENLEYCTPQENNLHASRMGLSRRGEEKPNAKLTENDAKRIIELAASGMLLTRIAAQFNVTPALVGQIVKGKAWQHLERPAPQPREHWTRTHPESIARGERNGSRAKRERLRKGSDHPNAKINEQSVRLLRKLYQSGDYTMRELADTFGIGKTQVKRIIDRSTWADLPN